MKTVIAFLMLVALPLAAQDMQSCPMHKEHMKEAAQHQADVEKHGDEAMGFPHDKTSHHFRLYSDGGAIEVTVNGNKDSQNRFFIVVSSDENDGKLVARCGKSASFDWS